MKKTERTGKAFRIKWLLLAVVAAALIFMPAASQKVSAGKLVYTVKFNNNSGTSKSKTYTALTRNVKLNTTIKLPAVPKAIGYQNLGWTTTKGSSKVVYKAGASIKVKKDMTLYAVRRKSKFYTVSFYLGNGSSTAAYRKLQKKVEEGTYYTLPAVPTRSGYVNLGWSTTINGKVSAAKKAGTKIKISGNIKYYVVQMQSVSVNLCKANGTIWKTVTLGKGGYLKLHQQLMLQDTRLWDGQKQSGQDLRQLRIMKQANCSRSARPPHCMQQCSTVHGRKISAPMRWRDRQLVCGTVK